jgi:hypothetical protein
MCRVPCALRESPLRTCEASRRYERRTDLDEASPFLAAASSAGTASNEEAVEPIEDPPVQQQAIHGLDVVPGALGRREPGNLIPEGRAEGGV